MQSMEESADFLQLAPVDEVNERRASRGSFLDPKRLSDWVFVLYPVSPSTLRAFRRCQI